MSSPARASDDRRRTSDEWLAALGNPNGVEHEQALADLHRLLLRAARSELARRRAALSHVRGEELEDLAMQAADDALVAVLHKLDTYRGASRFTTWAYKFALLEAGVRLRRRAWQGREVVLASVLHSDKQGQEAFVTVVRSGEQRAAARLTRPTPRRRLDVGRASRAIRG